MQDERNAVEFTVESDPWHTIWLIKKALYESEKKNIPLKIEVKTGSVESTISLIGDLATIGAFIFEMAKYVISRMKEEKPLKITGFSRQAAYANAKYILSRDFDVPESKLIEEHPKDGGYYFKFEDANGKIHHFYFDANFEMSYSRSKKFSFDEFR